MKLRNGTECKKTACMYYKDYKVWNAFSSSLKNCMNCKNAFKSQYTKRKEAK